MPSSQRPRHEGNREEPFEYVYRGRKIRVIREKERQRLFIDDREVMMEQTENGVLSHMFMFKMFSTPYELAEELIKQWGGATMKKMDQPHQHE